MKKVMAMGTFDMMHPGHLHYLEEARKMGDYLIVVVARDATVEKERGRRPVVHENDRLRIVKGLRVVDETMLGNIGDKLLVIEKVKPDVICLGYDQKMDEARLHDELWKRGLNMKVVRIDAYKKEKYKSSILKKKGLPD